MCSTFNAPWNRIKFTARLKWKLFLFWNYVNLYLVYMYLYKNLCVLLHCMKILIWTRGKKFSRTSEDKNSPEQVKKKLPEQERNSPFFEHELGISFLNTNSMNRVYSQMDLIQYVAIMSIHMKNIFVIRWRGNKDRIESKLWDTPNAYDIGWGRRKLSFIYCFIFLSKKQFAWA